MRLGRLPHDPARVARVATHRAALAVPPRLIRDPGLWRPMLGGNDALPTCTAVGLVNTAMAYAWAKQATGTLIDEARVPAIYAASIGRPDATDAQLAATDGAVMLDVLAWQAGGMIEVGQQTRLLALYRAIAPGDRGSLASAMLTCGAVYAGVSLLLADQADGDWLEPHAGAQQPWGGHALTLWGYTGLRDEDLVWVGTWGAWRRASWAWIHARLAEAYALTWPQLDAPPDA